MNDNATLTSIDSGDGAHLDQSVRGVEYEECRWVEYECITV